SRCGVCVLTQGINGWRGTVPCRPIRRPSTMTSAVTLTQLPTWDMTTIYPGVDSPEYAASMETIISGLNQLDAALTSAEALEETSGDGVTTVFERILRERDDVA